MRDYGKNQSLQINTRDALADGAQQVGSDRADATGDEMRGMREFSIGAIDGGDVADFAPGTSVTSIMVTSMETIPTMGASTPRISTLPRLPSER